MSIWSFLFVLMICGMNVGRRAVYCAKCAFELGGQSRVCPQCNGRKFLVTPPSGKFVDGSSAAKFAGENRRLHLIGALAFVGLLLIVWMFLQFRYVAIISSAHDGEWGHVSINAWLSEKTVFGESLPIPAHVASVTLRDAAGNTLYQGSSMTPVFADAQLGSEELVSVDVCMSPESGGDLVCQRDSIIASSKKTKLVEQPELTWPLSSANFVRGEYRLGMARLREMFGRPGVWEEIGGGTGSLRIEATVAGAAESGTVVVDVSADGSGHVFSLDQGAGFAGFQAAMEQALASDGDAKVTFRIVHTDSGRTTTLKEIQRIFHRKTQAEREAEVTRCAQAIAQAVVGMGYSGGNSVSGRPRGSWIFDQQKGRYFVDMETSWRGALTHLPYSIAGRVEFAEEGRSANFYLAGEDAAVKMLRIFSAIRGLQGSDLGNVNCGKSPST